MYELFVAVRQWGYIDGCAAPAEYVTAPLYALMLVCSARACPASLVRYARGSAAMGYGAAAPPWVCGEA